MKLNSPRIFFMVAATICGVIAVVGAIAIGLACFKTPQIEEIVIEVGRAGSQSRGKILYLLFGELPLIFFFVWMLWGVVFWDRLMPHARRVQSFFEKAFPSTKAADTPALYLTLAVLVCVFSALNLWELLGRVSAVLKLA